MRSYAPCSIRQCSLPLEVRKKLSNGRVGYRDLTTVRHEVAICYRTILVLRSKELLQFPDCMLEGIGFTFRVFQLAGNSLRAIAIR